MNLQLYHNLLVGVISALEKKDSATANHSLRVSDMAERVCKILWLPQEQTEIIHMSAHVHDIGKTGIPAYLLEKSGPLIAEEFEIIKKHPQIGADILNKLPGLSEVANIVLYHHERWDGTGYPDGLLGNAIPLGSRIISVCDSIDAMMSYRPYRKKLSCAQCKKEIADNGGTMYDPDIVEAVIKNWDSVILEEYSKQ